MKKKTPLNLIQCMNGKGINHNVPYRYDNYAQNSLSTALPTPYYAPRPTDDCSN